jgi:hypothetical protein
LQIDRSFGLIREWTTTNAAAHDGARLEDVLDRGDLHGLSRLGSKSAWRPR